MNSKKRRTAGYYHFLQLIGGQSSAPPSSTRKLEAATEESSRIPKTISLAQPEEPKTSGAQVIEVDIKTTEELEDDHDNCTMEPPSRQTLRSREEMKLQRQPSEDTLDNLSILFDKSLLVEVTSEDTWMDRLRRVIERGNKQGFELMGHIY